MTSPINHTETQAFFADRGYFGLSPDDVWFFSQGTLPCLTKEGKIILESAGVVATAPDGNGGFYPALSNTGYNYTTEQHSSVESSISGSRVSEQARVIRQACFITKSIFCSVNSSSIGHELQNRYF